MGNKVFKVEGVRRIKNLVLQVGGTLIAAGLIGWLLPVFLQKMNIISSDNAMLFHIGAGVLGFALVAWINIDYKPYSLTIEQDGLRVMRAQKEFGYYPFDEYTFGSYILTHYTNGIRTSKDVYLRVYDINTDDMHQQINLRGFTPKILQNAMTEIKLASYKDIENYEIPEKEFMLQSPVKEAKMYLNVEFTKSSLRLDQRTYSWDEIEKIQMTPPNYNSGNWTGNRTIDVFVNGKKDTFTAGPVSGKHAADSEYTEVWSILDQAMLKLKGISVNRL